MFVHWFKQLAYTIVILSASCDGGCDAEYNSRFRLMIAIRFRVVLVLVGSHFPSSYLMAADIRLIFGHQLWIPLKIMHLCTQPRHQSWIFCLQSSFLLVFDFTLKRNSVNKIMKCFSFIQSRCFTVELNFCAFFKESP